MWRPALAVYRSALYASNVTMVLPVLNVQLASQVQIVLLAMLGMLIQTAQFVIVASSEIILSALLAH